MEVNMWKCIAFLFAVGYITTVETNLDDWQQECPYPICTCHSIYLNDLPIFSLMRQTKIQMKTKHKLVEAHQTQLHQNEVLEENDLKVEQGENYPLLTTAMCVLGVGVDVHSLMSALPSTLEILIIMQSSDSGNITLELDHFNNLQDLIALEIHGFYHHKTNKSLGILSLQYDILKQLQSLKYLNLEHVQLLGPTEEYNKPTQILTSNFKLPTLDLSNNIPSISNGQYQISGPLDNHLQFLSESGDLKILPYEIYQKSKEYASTFTFSGLTQLKVLRIFHCNIKHLRWEMFDGLRNLEQLSLEGNLLLFIPDFSFYGTPSLKYLCLSHNNLLSIKSTDFIGLLQLEQLDISYNNISHLSELSLPPFPNLKSADFHHNPLEMIIPRTFDVMNVTEELYIGGYAATLEIQLNSFHGLQNILKLGMTNVRIKLLEKDHLMGMPKLKNLKIQGNISIISYDAFVEVNKLEVMVLNNCSIRQISMDAFYGLKDLLYLDLSNNLLESIPYGSFDQLGSLKELNLKSNRLTKLPIGIFSNLNLKIIRLDRNPWHCTCRMGEWNPFVINTIKKRTLNNPKCQFRFDKGSMCEVESVYNYIYDKNVTPRCATPLKYKGWSIFHVLQKTLRCEKKLVHDEKELYLFNKPKTNENHKKYTDQVKHNKLKKIIKIQNFENINNTEESDVDRFRKVSTKGLTIENNTKYFEQKVELNDDVTNELNILSNAPVKTKIFEPKIIVEDSQTLYNIMSELTPTVKDSTESHFVPYEVTSQTAITFTKFDLLSTLKLPLQSQFKNMTNIQDSLQRDNKQNSQNDEKIKSNYYKISGKSLRHDNFLKQEMMKVNKMKTLKERFKEKLQKTLQMNKKM